MGCDAHGIIEYKQEYSKGSSTWRFVGRLDSLVGRNYDTFGSLFGVRNTANFYSLFEKRGFPEELSHNGREELSYYYENGLVGAVDCHSMTYFFLDELDDVNWDQNSAFRDERISIVDEDGKEKLKFGYSSEVEEALTPEEMTKVSEGEPVELPNKTEDGEKRFAVCKKPTRKEVMSKDWEWFLFDYLESIGRRYGRENVRVTVWFDN